jgi:DNA polymerase I-like protein with 3'-5' exonuclease and polymerase domains
MHVNYHCQEIAIAAHLSSDPVMREMYVSNDAHMWFAIKAGAAPPGATKETHRTIRNLYKRISLNILYGLSAYGAAYRLQISIEQAQAIIDQHKDFFPTYWNWSERMVQSAYDHGTISTKCGWGCNVPQDSTPRTWLNWPIQSAGADIMRLTVIYLDQQGVQLLAPIHDGFLVMCKRNEISDLKSAINSACTMAREQVLGDFPMKWDISKPYYHRFEDEDGAPLWTLLVSALKELYPNYARYFE